MSLGIIILAGGKGTRIKSVLGETPKILAKVDDNFFLNWLLRWINSWKLETKYKIILSTCVGHDLIASFCNSVKADLTLIKEKRPLGTYGALLNTYFKTNYDNYLILNGDTIFSVDMNNVYKKYISHKKKALLVLKEANSNERFGGYKSYENYWIPSKTDCTAISLGAFFISREEIKKRWESLSKELSLDVEFFKLPKNINLMMDKDCIGIEPVRGELLSHNTKFIDIGIPSSLNKAQTFIPEIFL